MCAPSHYKQNYNPAHTGQYSLFGHPLSKVASHSSFTPRLQTILGKTYHRNYHKIVKSIRNG